jgi:predicted Zn-dependent protease with MMP-like domain
LRRDEFEQIVQEVLERLPDNFYDKIDNVRIVVEDFPEKDDEIGSKSDKSNLLGLYQGVPLPNRGSWYGAVPTVPDKITLFQRNIEGCCDTKEELYEKIYEVLLHELGHYYGMNEKEIRGALNNFKLY